VNRAHFQQLAAVRLREAESLLAAGLWDGAYYLAGYVVECGLKACILARIEREGVIFAASGKKFSEQCGTHDLVDLLKLAGLLPVLNAAMASDPDLQSNWSAAIAWSETSRYTRTAEADARSLLAAVADPAHGVWSWIQQQL
jgi:hypothetical protein